MSASTPLGTSPASRRKFLSVMTAAGLGAAATQLLAGQPRTDKQPPSRAGRVAIPRPAEDAISDGPETRTIGASDFTGIPGASIDVKVLNFALTLEILEADIYRQALNIASGRAASAALSSNSSVYERKVFSGGLSSEAANVGFVYLRDFAYVEAAHRDFLSAAITNAGATPVTRNAKGYKFPKQPKAEMKALLQAILPLEETGVRAYLGALRSFTSYSLAQTAATIFSTEARHSAAIHYILGQDPGPAMLKGDLSDPSGRAADNTYEYFLEPQTVLTAASAYFVK